MASCTYTVPDKNASGDDFYGQFICQQQYIDYFWNALRVRRQQGLLGRRLRLGGLLQHLKPLARTFNACYALTYSAQDWANESWNSPILNWGRRYVRNNIDDLQSKCGDGSATARSFTGIFVNDRVELYLGFFYSEDVPSRAGTLIHEARHQGGKGHNANFPAGSVFGAGKSGADSNWGYEGAWMYDALYLWWFFAAGARTTSAMRQRARQRGNLIIDNAFATHPGYSI